MSCLNFSICCFGGEVQGKEAEHVADGLGDRDISEHARYIGCKDGGRREIPIMKTGSEFNGVANSVGGGEG